MNFFKKNPVPVLDTFPMPDRPIPLLPHQITFYTTLVNDIGGTSLNGKDRERAIQKLAQQYDLFMSGYMERSLSESDRARFAIVKQSKPSQQQVDAFFKSVPNIQEIFQNSYGAFRESILARMKK